MPTGFTHTVYIQRSMLRYNLYALYQGVASIFTRSTTILNESVINALFKLPSHLESSRRLNLCSLTTRPWRRATKSISLNHPFIPLQFYLNHLADNSFHLNRYIVSLEPANDLSVHILINVSLCQGVASLYYIYASKNVSDQHLVRRLLLHFITIIVAAFTILDGLGNNWLVNDVTKERIVTGEKENHKPTYCTQLLLHARRLRRPAFTSRRLVLLSGPATWQRERI